MQQGQQGRGQDCKCQDVGGVARAGAGRDHKVAKCTKDSKDADKTVSSEILCGREGGSGCNGLSAGFPASGKTRENQGKFFPSGKSGNFALTEVNQISTLIQMHFFFKPDVCQDFFALLHSAFYNKVYTLKSGKKSH